MNAFPRSLAIALVLASLVAALPHDASAAPTAPASVDIQGDVVWTTPHDASGGLVIENGSRLTVLGTTVVFGGGQLTVREQGVLVIASDGANSSIVRGGSSWRSFILGSMWLNGTAAAPAVVTGIGGQGSLSSVVTGGNAIMMGALTIAGGSLHADHATISNYSSGIIVGNTDAQTGALEARNVTFSSREGAGLLVETGHANVSDARFDGPG